MLVVPSVIIVMLVVIIIMLVMLVMLVVIIVMVVVSTMCSMVVAMKRNAVMVGHITVGQPDISPLSGL